MSRFLPFGPLLVLIVWFAAGQWAMAGDEARSWLELTGTLCLASLIPLPGTARLSAASLRDRLRWWGWVVVIGLLVTS